MLREARPLVLLTLYRTVGRGPRDGDRNWPPCCCSYLRGISMRAFGTAGIRNLSGLECWMLRVVNFGRILRVAYAAAVAVWICALIFLQWIVLMAPSALQVEAATGIPLIDFSHWVRGHLSKPRSPPAQ